MTKSIEFYFDFISPYSFLAYKKLKSLNKNDEINVNYKPILLGGLHKLGGIIAPAFNERKMKNMKNDCELVAKKNFIESNIDYKVFTNTVNIKDRVLYIVKIGPIKNNENVKYVQRKLKNNV